MPIATVGIPTGPMLLPTAATCPARKKKLLPIVLWFVTSATWLSTGNRGNPQRQSTRCALTANGPAMSLDPPRYGTARYGVARYTSASTTGGVKKRMAKIALKLDRLSVNDKIEKGRRGITAAGSTEGVAVLGTPAPAEVAALLGATNGLETARDDKVTADNNAKTATQAQLAAEQAFDEAYAAYGRVGQTKTGGDPVKIGAIGMDVAGVPTPLGPMPAPQGLVATMSEIAGQVDLMCEPVKGAKMYIWQVCADPMSEANWRQVDVNTASKMTVTDLTSGTKYWFRVAAKASGAQGPWSDPAQKMAP